MVGWWCTHRDPTCYFHSAYGFATQTLAYMLDSLVRVSRRVDWKNQVNLLSEQVPVPPGCTQLPSNTYQRQCYQIERHSRKQRRWQHLIPHSKRQYQPGPTTPKRSRAHQRFSYHIKPGWPANASNAPRNFATTYFSGLTLLKHTALISRLSVTNAIRFSQAVSP